MGKLYDLIYKRFGIKTFHVINPLNDTVGVTPVRILANNPDRIAFLVFNLGNFTCYIAPDNKVSADYGMLISSKGGFINMVMEEDFELLGYEFFAISPDGNTKIFIMELVAE